MAFAKISVLNHVSKDIIHSHYECNIIKTVIGKNEVIHHWKRI